MERLLRPVDTFYRGRRHTWISFAVTYKCRAARSRVSLEPVENDQGVDSSKVVILSHYGNRHQVLSGLLTRVNHVVMISERQVGSGECVVWLRLKAFNDTRAVGILLGYHSSLTANQRDIMCQSSS